MFYELVSLLPDNLLKLLDGDAGVVVVEQGLDFGFRFAERGKNLGVKGLRQKMEIRQMRKELVFANLLMSTEGHVPGWKGEENHPVLSQIRLDVVQK